MDPSPILKEGQNCWCIKKAPRAALLIDGEAFFSNLIRLIRRAEQTLYIAGWDFDSRIDLSPEKERKTILRPLLDEMTRKNDRLHIYILTWDWTMVFFLERQWFSPSDNWIVQNDRIHFHLDGEHPIGASQHQKMVVIDDAVAFCGGFDLTKNRWDTSDHLPDNPNRKTANGKTYIPFHDAQLMVDGEPAAVLGDLFRKRWAWATGRYPIKPSTGAKAKWPPQVTPDFTDVPIGIARTLPGFRKRPQVREILAFCLEAIQSASRYIYIESQYLTSQRIAEALSKQLRKERGPEIIVVIPRKSSGWLEQSTMDSLRNRIVIRLRRIDRTKRIRFLYPTVNGTPVYVHAKIMIVDDRILMTGSSNMSNRSMGLDSECSLIIDADGENRHISRIRGLRNRLIGEHLGITEEEMSERCGRNDSLIEIIAAFSDSADRRLTDLDPYEQPPIDGASMVPEKEMLDPEKPLEFDRIMDQFVYDGEEHRSGKSQVIQVAAVLALLLVLAAAWRWTPMSSWIDARKIAELAIRIKGYAYTPIIIAAAYMVAGLAMIPITLLIGATGIVFSPIPGIPYALFGCLVSALSCYAIGARLGRKTIRKVAGKRLNHISRRLADQGILTVAVIRNLPIAPFSIVNIVAGASHLKIGDFLIGTAVGMLPGIIAVVVFSDRLLAAFRNPHLMNIFIAAFIAVVLILGSWWAYRRLSRNGSMGKK